MEEIYPPKLAEFAYVTDGACSEIEIQEKELVIMKVGGPVVVSLLYSVSLFFFFFRM
jgi:hypothetical protein